MFLVRNYTFLYFLTLLINPSKCIVATRIDVQYCGFEQKCGGNQTNVVASEDSCCQPCECVDVCKERNTCCPDMDRPNVTEEIIKQQCLPTEFVSHGLKVSVEYNSYYVRSRCPKSFTENDVTEHCEKQSYDTIEEITFVSSEDGNIIYRNKFCALCYGDKRTKPWALLVSRNCMTMLGEADVTLSTVNKQILSNCKISLMQPRGIQIKQNLCFNDDLVIGRCNYTGEWDVYNNTLEELCLHPQEPVLYYFYRADINIVYRSVYCYLCNTNKANQIPVKCEVDFQKTTGALSAIIKQSALTSTKDRQEQSTKCNMDEILDTFFNICRRLYCQRFFLPDFGQCKPFLDTEFSYKLFVKLDFLELSDFLKLDFTSLSVRVLTKLGFGRCMICSFNFLIRRDLNETLPSEVYLDATLAPTEKCKIEYLFSKITALEMSSSNINIMLNKTTVSFVASWNNGTLLRNDKYERIYKPNIRPCGISFHAESLSKCAKVKLGIQDYRSVLRNHKNGNQLLSAPIKEDMNGTFYVCIDKYIVTAGSVGYKAKNIPYVAIVTFIIISQLSTF